MARKTVVGVRWEEYPHQTGIVIRQRIEHWLTVATDPETDPETAEAALAQAEVEEGKLQRLHHAQPSWDK